MGLFKALHDAFFHTVSTKGEESFQQVPVHADFP